jgi:hypothetical protein
MLHDCMAAWRVAQKQQVRLEGMDRGTARQTD